MKSYFENKEFIIPYDKVMFCQWVDELGEMVLKVNFQSIQGGDSYWKLSLTGSKAQAFLAEYRSWLSQK
ncbi:MAG: hypothetical protein K9M99_07660 [Candidatus Cloacimonetes bacterium]|nr:hypothetical protein [Candidatus Cloacimonadota bacterium]